MAWSMALSLLLGCQPLRNMYFPLFLCLLPPPLHFLRPLGRLGSREDL